MHIPVMVRETIDLLKVVPKGIYVDATFGRGGHSGAILEKLDSDGRLLAIDRDAAAFEGALDKLAGFRAQLDLRQANFCELGEVASDLNISAADGVLFDVGFSSTQVDDPQRGFSFVNEGPLDMRMDTSQDLRASDLVNNLDEKELADTIYKYGEERSSRRIARAIVRERRQGPIESTLQLAELIERANPRRGARIHPATRTFQALRIAVNRELECLEKGLEAALSLVRSGGRVVVISFHSLEDRLVKRLFKRHKPKEQSLQAGGVREIYDEPAVDWVVRKPLTASEEEKAENPRARSAKVRAVERRGRR